MAKASTFSVVLWLAWWLGAAADAPTKPDAADEGLNLHPVAVLGDGRCRHAGSITHIEPLSDGRRALVSSRDGSARLWDLSTGRELQRFCPPKGEDVWNVRVLPGERQILSCGGDNHVTRWDLKTGESLARYRLSTTVMRLAVVPGGKQFVACDSGRHASLWDIASGARVQIFKGHKSSVYSAAISPDGQTLVTCSEDGSVRAYEIAGGKSLWKVEKVEVDEPLPGGADPFGGPPRLPEKKEEGAKKKKDLGPGHSQDVYTVCFLPDGKHVVSCSEDESVALWNVADGKPVWKISLTGGATVVCASPNGQHLAVSCDDESLHVLRSADGKTVKSIKLPGDAHWPVTWSTDGQRLLSGGDHIVYQWDAASGEQLFPPASNEHVRGSISRILIAPDGKRLYASGSDERLFVWDLTTRKRVAVWPIVDGVFAMELSADSRRLLLAGYEQIAIYDAASGKHIRSITTGHSNRAVAFAAGGSVAVTGDWSGQLKAWNTQSGQLLFTVPKPDDNNDDIEDILAAGDGQHFVVISEQNVEVRKTADGSVLLRRQRKMTGSLGAAAMLSGDQGLLLFNDSSDAPQMSVLLPEVAAGGEDVPPEQIRDWSAQLGDEDFLTRERAMLSLIRTGPPVLPRLQAANLDDSEVRWRVAEIRERVREGLLPTQPLDTRSLNEDIGQAAARPGSTHWAMVAGDGCRSRIQLGRVQDRQISLGKSESDGHSPRCVAFSPEGTHVYTGNWDGTISVYQCR